MKKNMENQSENPKTFAETKQPLLVNSAGVEITPELLLNDENILNELVSYYEWDNFEDEIVESKCESAFIHYLADSDARYIDDDSLNKFTESYYGSYDSFADFAEELLSSEVIHYAFYDNIDWAGVGVSLESMGEYTYIGGDELPTYVFRNL